jgi:hypothetical protein
MCPAGGDVVHPGCQARRQLWIERSGRKSRVDQIILPGLGEQAAGDAIWSALAAGTGIERRQRRPRHHVDAAQVLEHQRSERQRPSPGIVAAAQDVLVDRAHADVVHAVVEERRSCRLGEAVGARNRGSADQVARDSPWRIAVDRSFEQEPRSLSRLAPGLAWQLGSWREESPE